MVGTLFGALIITLGSQEENSEVQAGIQVLN